MFEWFFGNPKKKELKDYNWLKEQLAKEPATQRELDEIFSEIETLVKDLDRKSLQLYLKEGNIIEKCDNLDIEILQNKPVEEIKTNLESYEESLRRDLYGIIEAIEVAKKESGTPQEVFNNFKELVEDNLKGIARNMSELVSLHDFLEHIHLSPEEIEFWTMRKRLGCKNVQGEKGIVEAVIYNNKILYRENSEVYRFKLRNSQTNATEWNEHIQLVLRSTISLENKNTNRDFVKELNRLKINKEDSQHIPDRINNSKSIAAVNMRELKAIRSMEGIFRRNQFTLNLAFDRTVGFVFDKTRGIWAPTKRLRLFLYTDKSNPKDAGRYHSFPNII